MIDTSFRDVGLGYTLIVLDEAAQGGKGNRLHVRPVEASGHHGRRPAAHLRSPHVRVIEDEAEVVRAVGRGSGIRQPALVRESGSGRGLAERRERQAEQQSGRDIQG